MGFRYWNILPAVLIGLGAYAADGQPSGATETTNAQATAMVPAAIKESGVLRVGTNMPYPPMEFFEADGTTPTGVDIDLSTEIAARLGLRVEFVNMNWDGLIPALNSGRFEMIAAAVGDFLDRQKQADFVDYLTTGVSVIVNRADEGEYGADSDMCGKRVSAMKGTAAAGAVERLAKQCADEGKAAISLSLFADENVGLLAVRSKRADAHAMDAISASFEASTEQGRNVYRKVLPDFGSARILYGFVIAKSNRPLTEAVALVLGDMMADGTYKAILEKYGVADAAIPSATINAGKVESAH